jgi:serpin B
MAVASAVTESKPAVAPSSALGGAGVLPSERTLELPGVVERPADADVARLAQALNSLGLELFAKLDPKGNLALSPASLGTALGMTAFGARGETATEMKKVLHLAATDDGVAKSYAWLLRSWAGSPREGLVVAVANRLFAEQSLSVERPFVDLTRSRFGAALEQVPFSSDPEVVRALINNWVEGATSKRVIRLLPAGSVTSETRLALVNALYFKARWDTPFRERNTRDAGFFVRGTEEAAVPTMHETGSFRFADVGQADVLELPYEGGAFACGFVLPKTKDGLATLEAALDAKVLEAWTNKLAVERVEVALPRFKVEPTTSLKLGPYLMELGMKTAFDNARADFSGIAVHTRPEDRLSIGEVFHKTFVAIDEQGTEAAAATAVLAGRGGARPGVATPKTFVADHPFVFYVRDTATGALLFLGRMLDPRA